MNSNPDITISAPGRLHFGLFAVGDVVPRPFGGIGLMVEQPRTTIEASSAENFQQVGTEQSTIRVAAERWFRSCDAASKLQVPTVDDLPVKLDAIQVPPRHSGLGSGTQIALATAMALNQFFQLPTPSIGELSVALGRARRSAIGSHGFVEGGFLVDHGKAVGEPFASLDFQCDFPSDWPIVLIFVDQPKGLAGEQEQAAFDKIPATTLSQYSAMRSIVTEQIVPALVQTDYQSFAESLFDFGHRSGLFFESVQGGAYNGSMVSATIDQVRKFGVAAVGQTSWGPCVFAITEDSDQANALATSIRTTFGENYTVQITRADNAGALLNGQPNLLGRSSVTHRLET